MKKYFILAAAAIMISACSFDHELEYDGSGTTTTPEGSIPLTLGYSMGTGISTSTTRANTADLQKNAIDAANTNMIGLFVLKSVDGTTPVNTASETYERINFPTTQVLTGNPAAGYALAKVNPTPTAADALVYPEDKSQKIDIYAYSPYISNTDNTTGASYIPASFGTKNATSKLYEGNISTHEITFVTKTDQTEKADYYLSDVLWGCAGTGKYVSDAATNANGAYKLLEWADPSNPMSFLTSANNNEISANKYLEVKKNDANSDDTPDFTSDTRVGAYYFKYSSSDADVVVPMLHRGSQIIMNITTSGMDYKKLQNAEVEFYVDYLSGTLNISTGAFTPITTPAASGGKKILLTTHLGIEEPAAATSVIQEGEYESGGTGTGVDGYTCSAIIIPQTITEANGGTGTNQGKEPIIKIKLKDDTSKGAINGSTVKETATYSYKTGEAATEFKSGKKYIYNIIVKASGLSVTTSVQDWTDGSSSLPGTTPGAGDAELE